MESSQSNEVSTQHFFARIKNFFKGILSFFLSIFLTIHRNGKVFYPLLLIVTIIGGYVDYIKPTSYKNEILVATNYGSTDYLYSEIDRIGSFKENATDSQKKQWFEKISGVKVEPIRDPYAFLKTNYEYIYFFSILSDHGIDLEKYFESKIMDKRFRYHKITFLSDIDKDSTLFLANFLLDNLNQTKYFNERMVLEQENIRKKKAEYESSIEQINGLYESFANSKSIHGSSVAINQYEGIDQLIEQKRKLLEQVDFYDLYLLEGQKPIFPINISVNKKALQIPNIILLPFLTILLGLVILSVRKVFIQLKKNL